MRQRKTKQISFRISEFALHRGKVQAQRLGLQWGGYVLRALKQTDLISEYIQRGEAYPGALSRRVICRIPEKLWQEIRDCKKKYRINTMHLIGEIVANQIVKDEKDGEKCGTK